MRSVAVSIMARVSRLSTLIMSGRDNGKGFGRVDRLCAVHICPACIAAAGLSNAGWKAQKQIPPP